MYARVVFGVGIVSCLESCPHFSGVVIEGFPLYISVLV